VTDELAALREALGSRYALGDELGRGGMATVYRAQDLKHQREVAVKVLLPDVASAVGLERFLREIEIAAALQHPGIVPLFDSGGSGQLLYYIMPLVSGESLRDRLRREGSLPVEQALAITREVADALAFAHARGIVHRDIKPENILLSGGHAMIADFGVARALAGSGGRLTEQGLAIGTPAYMSPEQAGGADVVDGRSDVYALGCVLYEMLAGEPPFTGRTAQAILARHLQERPPSLQVVRPTVAPSLQAAVERALAKVPADRYATATQFAEAVEASGSARPAGGLALALRALGPARLAMGLVAAGAVAAAWLLTHRFPAADANRVVVYPLSQPGPGVPEGTGEQVALMIGSALEHTEPLTWRDGAELLGAGGDARVQGAAAVRAARRAGARYFVDGAIVPSGDSLTVIVRLHDAVADTLVRQESASGAATASAPQLALRAIGRILPRLLPPNGRVDLSYLADRDPAAVADWLQGEREFAHGQYGAAMDHMGRALARDSAMGVAALKGAQAAAHLEDYLAAQQLVQIALRLDRQLPRHHRALARGLDDYLRGAADSALVEFAAARAGDTTWAEPLMWMGETYYHLMPAGGNLDSLAERAFASAVARNPGFAPAQFHLAEIAARRGDTRVAAARLEAFRRVSPDSDWTFQLALTVRCAASGPDGIDWPAAVRRGSDRVVTVARVLGSGAAYPACARRALEAVLADDTAQARDHVIFRWSALKGLTYLDLAEGRDAQAVARLDSARTHGTPAAGGLFVLAAAAGVRGAEPQAESTMASLEAPLAGMRSLRLWYFTIWDFFRGNTTRLDSVQARLAAIADSSGQPSDRLISDGAAARAALRQGDTAAAIRRLEGLRPVNEVGPLTWDYWESAPSDRLLLAQLLLATGDAAGAIRVASQFDSPRAQVHLLYLVPSLQVRVRAAEVLGRAAEQARYRSQLAALGRLDGR